MSALGDNGNYDVIPIAVIETEPLHSLTDDDFSFVDEILECDDELNFYMELHCDARSIFGSLGGIAPDDYLNVYANYNVTSQHWYVRSIRMTFSMCTRSRLYNETICRRMRLRSWIR